jgi:hypothetical protein
MLNFHCHPLAASRKVAHYELPLKVKSQRRNRKMNNRSSIDSQGISSVSKLFESLLLQSCSQPSLSQQTALQVQVNALLGLLHACLEQPLLQASTPGPEVQNALSAFHTVEPLIAHIPTMLNLLVRAGIEINGNPFLDEDTTLHEIRQFLRLNEVMVMLPQVIFNLEPEQAEIAEDLLGLDPDDNSVSGGFFPASEIRKSASFPLSELVGRPMQAGSGQEWEWVRRNSGLTKPADAGRLSGGFVLDLGQPLSDAPARLKPMLAEAREKGLAYLIIY